MPPCVAGIRSRDQAATEVDRRVPAAQHAVGEVNAGCGVAADGIDRIQVKNWGWLELVVEIAGKSTASCVAFMSPERCGSTSEPAQNPLRKSIRPVRATGSAAVPVFRCGSIPGRAERYRTLQGCWMELDGEGRGAGARIGAQMAVRLQLTGGQCAAPACAYRPRRRAGYRWRRSGRWREPSPLRSLCAAE
jgi:hypothetical protein